MKRILTPFFLLLISFQSFAQSYSLNTDTIRVGGDFIDLVIDNDTLPISATVHITNQSNSTKLTVWVRTEQLLPSGWETSVCDPVNCYLSNTSTQEFSMEPNANGSMIVDFYPIGGGVSVTSLHIYDKNNDNDNVDATFIATVSASNGVRKIQRVKDIYLSPVPAKENLSVVYDVSLNPSKVEIYNVLGQILKTVKIANDGTSKVELNLSGFEKGLYFLRLYTGDNKVLTRQFSKD